MPLSNAEANALLNHYFGKATYTPEANIYVGFSTTTPAADGSNVTELAGTGRAETSPSDWNSAASRQITNANLIETSAASASGTVTHFVLYDAASAGNFLGSGALSSGQAVTSGQTIRAQPGALVASIP